MKEKDNPRAGVNGARVGRSHACEAATDDLTLCGGEGRAPMPDAALAAAFLNLVLPQASCALASLDPEVRGAFSMTAFSRLEHPDGGVDRLRSWLEAENRQRNVYFGTNACVGPAFVDEFSRLFWWLDGSVSYAHLLWVEIRPHAGWDLADERARILALLRVPQPGPATLPVVLDTGWSVWGLWPIERLPLHGDLAKALYASRLSGMARLHGGEPQTKLNRHCPLPGSIHWPSAEMRAHGAVPFLVRLYPDGELA